MVSPRRLAAALSLVSAPLVVVVYVAVMSLPPVMKKRDGPPCGRQPRLLSYPESRGRLLGDGIAVVSSCRCGLPYGGKPWAGPASASSRGRHRRELGTAALPMDIEGVRLCVVRVGWVRREHAPQTMSGACRFRRGEGCGV